MRNLPQTIGLRNKSVPPSRLGAAMIGGLFFVRSIEFLFCDVENKIPSYGGRLQLAKWVLSYGALNYWFEGMLLPLDQHERLFTHFYRTTGKRLDRNTWLDRKKKGGAS